jgi:hypothetical protein
MTPHELRKKIKAIKRLNLRHANLDSLKTALAPILHHYVHPSPLIQPGERIYRAVLWPNRPTHKSQLGYPPSDKVNFGRCNRLGEPVFYGSVGSTAAIQELAPLDGTRLAISMWRVTKPVLAASVGYSQKAFSDLGSTRWSQIWWRQQISTEPDPVGANTLENRFLDNFIASEFTKRVSKGDEWQYTLSVAISESYLKGRPAEIFAAEIPGVTRPGETLTGIELGGLVYPSIATGANDDNIVLKCAIADSSLAFVWVHYLEISRPTAKVDEFTPKGVDFANQLSASGEIQWLGNFPNTLVAGTDFRLDMDGTALVLKDSLNRLVGQFSVPTPSK